MQLHGHNGSISNTQQERQDSKSQDDIQLLSLELMYKQQIFTRKKIEERKNNDK